MNKFNKFFKRVFDILASGIGIIVLSPILIVIAIAIKCDSNGEILFKQKRVGMNEKTFNIFKFRTMVTNAEKLGKQITVGNDCRITKIGSFLRKYKLDELPQLFNVLLGDMSLVGPRPEVRKYVDLYTDEQQKVLSVKPGITDYASIEYMDENEILGKSSDPEKTYIEEIMPEKIKYNMKYIQNKNVSEYFKIIFLTLLKIVR